VIAAEFHYHVSWRTGSVYPGAHPGRQSGAGLLFRWHVPLIQYPDPRRIDLRASLLDPFQQCQVRVQEQRGNITVFVIVDLSASMGYQGRHAKMQTVADFLTGLAASASRLGDPVGLAAIAETHHPAIYLAPSRHHSVVRDLAKHLSSLRLTGANVRGLARVGQFLPASRCLVFLLSDFYFPLGFLKQTLAGLALHDVVPVVLWDEEEQSPAQNGLATLKDMESGHERLLWLRPQLRARLLDSFKDRRQKLVAVLRRFGREPLFLQRGFNADAVTRYFLRGA
jgi:uncharacterized protein (DUF58 family)